MPGPERTTSVTRIAVNAITYMPASVSACSIESPRLRDHKKPKHPSASGGIETGQMPRNRQTAIVIAAIAIATTERNPWDMVTGTRCPMSCRAVAPGDENDLDDYVVQSMAEFADLTRP